MLGACAVSDNGAATGGVTPEATAGLSGSIDISGPLTVEPITALVREEYITQNSDVAIDVDGLGTGDGFKLFCAGETQISDASRPIKEAEAADCKAAGIELVIEDAGEARVESGDISENDVGSARDDCFAQPDDNAIIESASADPGGLGWVGFAFADQADGVKLVPIASEPDGECVAPAAETIQDGSYPLSRSLYIYVNAAEAENNEAMADFVTFYLAGLTDFVELSDYVALSSDVETLDVWESRTSGTRQN